MASWKGQSRGTLLGYKIFIFFIRRFGIKTAYLLLRFVSVYYLIFSFETTRNTYVFFRRRRGLSTFKSFLNCYKTYVKLGQSLIDRVAISSGMRQKFSFEFDGVENIKDLLNEGRGGVLFTGHLGNFNIAKYFFEELDHESKINMLVTDQEHKEIKEYIASVTHNSNLKFIVIQEDLSHIFEINSALSNNEIIVFAADRYSEGTKFIQTDFLGKPAKFTQGPYKIAARKNLPAVFVYIMKERNLHYHFYARKCQLSKYSPEELLKAHVESMTTIVDKYPNQWFNFYDYWEDFID